MKLEFCKFEDFLNEVKKFTKTNLVETYFKLQEKGLEIKSLDELTITEEGFLLYELPDGTFTPVNLYIQEDITKLKKNEIILKLKKGELPRHKYHIFKCGTLIEMFNSGRKHRYKINTRTDEKFYYRFIDDKGNVVYEDENIHLNICKNCLRKYKSIKQKGEIKESFNLENFHKYVKQKFSSEDLKGITQAGKFHKPNIYPKNWKEISRNIKEKRNYTCEKCGWKPKNEYEKRFIHVHHINGDKTDNREENLQVLCKDCHANVDKYHSRLKANKRYKEFLNIYKKR